jgi:hypothetical protein
MIMTTERVICTETLFDEDAIVLRIEDQAAGPYLAVYSRKGSETGHEYGIGFSDVAELYLFYRAAKEMLEAVQS